LDSTTPHYTNKKKAGGDVSVYRVENNLNKSREFNSINSTFKIKTFILPKPLSNGFTARRRHFQEAILTEMSTRNLPGGKGWPERKADNLTAICEPTV
jgi:hypothetical protein